AVAPSAGVNAGRAADAENLQHIVAPAGHERRAAAVRAGDREVVGAAAERELQGREAGVGDGAAHAQSADAARVERADPPSAVAGVSDLESVGSVAPGKRQVSADPGERVE